MTHRCSQGRRHRQGETLIRDQSPNGRAALQGGMEKLFAPYSTETHPEWRRHALLVQGPGATVTSQRTSTKDFCTRRYLVHRVGRQSLSRKET